MTRRQTNLIIIGILLSLFLSSMEGSVVTTAMPSIVAQLGGLSIYSWVFSIFMLTSTTTVPVYGKLSDIYGRKLIYTISMLLFLLGSVLCALAQSMEQLIIFRAVQGLGAGGVLPLAFTIIGELFSLEERARMQGLFSSVWSISAIIGPLIGGFLVDQISWHWVFLINLVPGAVAAALVWFAWKGKERSATESFSIDYAGAILLTLAALSLLLGLNNLRSPFGWAGVALALALAFALVKVEQRHPHPLLPPDLFRDRLFNIAILHGVFSGWAMFGSLSYVPLFVQGVLGTSATQAGITLTPMSLSWTLASILGSRLLLKMGFRTLSVFGMALLVIGAFLMTQINASTSQLAIMVYTGTMGVGMGLSIPAFLIAVQSTVRREELGVATSTVQFSRSIGGTIGVSILGAFLSARLAGLLVQSGLDPSAIRLESLLESMPGASAAVEGPLRAALSTSIANMFYIALAAALAGFVAVLFTPAGKIAQIERKPEQPTFPEG